MKGHENLIQMRTDGYAPDYVFINDFPCETNWNDFNEAVTISTADDNIKLLDLRFIVGMNVLVLATDKLRANDLYKACKQHKAKMVVVSCKGSDLVKTFGVHNG
tara:strand:+ start:1659 stop:1970 length:312 start_codon:yes stop_codon:yes gene_type:complete